MESNSRRSIERGTMNIHIVTPFYRKHLLKTLIHYLQPMNIIWHPVCDPVDIQAFKNNIIGWIQPVLCKPLEWSSLRKINDFIETQTIIDGDYYCCMGDDDMYEEGIFDEIRKQTAKVIFISLCRGNEIPKGSPHPTNPLIIKGPEDVKICAIGLPQYIVKGSIFKQMKMDTTTCHADGTFAEELKDRFPNDCIYRPDLFTFGNYFEPGRFTNDSFKIKPNWRLPEIL
jgi:hypothetical protein